MSLVPDYEGLSESDSSSSSSNSDTDTSTFKDVHKLPPPSQAKLPTPNFGEAETSVEDLKSSVFKNPFVEAENAKAAILQKHVKMVDTKDNVVVINGKKICWNYRKGRCRFGHNCKFAHDSDIQKTTQQIEIEKAAALKKAVVCHGNQTGSNQIITAEKSGSDESLLNKKRKRPGLSQGLVPGKKVLKQYLKNKS